MTLLSALAFAGGAEASVRVNAYVDPRFSTGPYLTTAHAPDDTDTDAVRVSFDAAAETYLVSDPAGARPVEFSYYCSARNERTVECEHPNPSSSHLVIESDLDERDSFTIERDVPYSRSRLNARRVTGGAGRDRVYGTREADRLRGRVGDDRINGVGGPDEISGGGGEDRVEGGRSPDRLEGNSGDDLVVARDHSADTIRCGPGVDTATVDRRDRIRGCEHVIRPRDDEETLATATPRATTVARDFHGVVIQQPPDESDVKKMTAAEVGAIRFPISWQATERRPGVYRWDDVDDFMEAAAETGAEPLPFVSVKPDWLQTDWTGQPMSTPESRAAWEDFARAIAARYGPGGTFIAEHPEVAPITTWQLWNEPNLKGFWGADPSPSQYATLAGLGSAAIREIDPDAEIMLAGLAPAKRGYKPWKFLEATLPQIEPGTFDEVAIHPYGEKLKDVRAQISDARREMSEAGFGDLPLAVTEIGWGSEMRGVKTLQGSQKLQARNLRDVYADLASRRAFDIPQVFWFSWRDSQYEVNQCGFCATSGLLKARGRAKPAYDAFAASARKLRG